MPFPEPPASITSSPMASLLDSLELHGYRPAPDEPDPRPLPADEELTATIGGLFDHLTVTFSGTGLEADLDPVLWSLTNVFHLHLTRIDRDLDRNEQAQRRSQAEQDGSELRSVELEQLLDQGRRLLERRQAIELMRDEAASHYEVLTGSPWWPRAGSKVSNRHLTAAVIDSREHIATRKAAAANLLIPPGPKIAFSGGTQCNDHAAIWDTLDKVRVRHPDMVLLHGGSPTGAERIAACWASNRNIPQIVFRPDWPHHGKAAPFKRNDAMLETMPIGVVLFTGSGITDNLADKARRMGIPLVDRRR